MSKGKPCGPLRASRAAADADDPELAAVAAKFGIRPGDRFDLRGFINLVSVPGCKPVHPTTVWRWMRGGRLGFTRIGRRVVITDTDALEFLARGTNHPGPQPSTPVRSPASRSHGHRAALRALRAAGLLPRDDEAN